MIIPAISIIDLNHDETYAERVSLIQDKQNEVERLNDRIAEVDGINRDKDNMISDMQRKLDFRWFKEKEGNPCK